MAAMAWEDAGRLAFQNMQLLGFDPDEAAQRHGAEVGEATFLKTAMAGSGLGPHREMEAVMHFLMLRILAPDAQAPLKALFPVVDKQQARDFRKFVADHLGALQKAKELPPGPLIRVAIFEQPCGPKFCQVLFHVSQYAMKRQILAMKKTVAPVPAFQRQNARTLVRVARRRVVHERHLFLDYIRRAGAAQEYWTQFADEFVEAHQKTAASRAQVAAVQHALASQRQNKDDSCPDHEAAEAHAEDLDQSVRSMWMAVEGSGLTSSSQREAVERLLVNVSDEKKINIAERMRQRSQALDPSAPVGDENVDMESLLQRWAANIGSLHRQLLVNTAGRGGLERMAKSETDIRSLAEAAQGRLVSAQELRRQLAADVEGMRHSLADLRRIVAQRCDGGLDQDSSLEVEDAERSVSRSPARERGGTGLQTSPPSEKHLVHISPAGSGTSTLSNQSQPVVNEAAAAAAVGAAGAAPADGAESAVSQDGVSATRQTSTSAKISELDARMRQLRDKLSSPQNAAVADVADSTPSFSSSPKPRLAPAPLTTVASLVKPPPTPPPAYSALRSKRQSNSKAAPSPAALAPSSVVTAEPANGQALASLDPAPSEIDRRRALLRNKMTAALDDDDLLAPPVAISTGTPDVAQDALAGGHLAQVISPPKHAGKGSVVGDDPTSVGRFFGE